MFKKLILIPSIFILILPIAAAAKSDLWQTRQTINIVEEIEGEAILIGKSIAIEKKIKGDLLAAGRQIIISAPVAQDARIAGERVLLNSQINGNATILADEIILDKIGEVQGNARVWASELDLSGKVGGDIIFRGDVLKISGQIDGNADFGEIANLIIDEEARISGDLKYQAKKPFDIPDNVVLGKIDYKPLQDAGRLIWQHINLFWQMVWFFAALALGLILINFFGSRIKQINILMVKKPGKSLLLGLIFAFILPIISVLLIITLIGIPLGMIIFVSWILLLYTAPILTSVILGKLVVSSLIPDKERLKQMSMVWFMIIGLLCLRLIFLVPWIGGPSKVLTVFWGLGGVLYLFKNNLNAKETAKIKN